jgi:acetoin utilization deacetylase AcuC-like enzyme
MVKQAAAELCQGKLVLEQEGGYSTAYVPFCGLAVVEELSGIKTAAEDPFLEFYKSVTGQDLQPNQKHVVDEAAKLVSRIS